MYKIHKYEPLIRNVMANKIQTFKSLNPYPYASFTENFGFYLSLDNQLNDEWYKFVLNDVLLHEQK